MRTSLLRFGFGRRALLELLLGAGVVGLPARAFGNELRFRVITHPNNPFGSVSREFVADAFLKKASRWQDGEAIQPVDLRADAPVRRSFSDSVLKRSVSAVKIYWQQRIFSGRGVPPPELDSDQAVIAYVASRRGGIGYVSEGAKLESVKVCNLR
jgi:ABC-type phosphate transport system substrate-binding protein